jgi:hypothetical protein
MLQADASFHMDPIPSGECLPDRAPPNEWMYGFLYNGRLGKGETHELAVEFCVGSDGLLPSWRLEGSAQRPLEAVMVDPNGTEWPIYQWDRSPKYSMIRDGNGSGTGVPIKLHRDHEEVVEGVWTLRLTAGKPTTVKSLVFMVSSYCSIINLAQPLPGCTG